MKAQTLGLVIFLTVATGYAEDAKEGRLVSGRFKKTDLDKGIIILTIGDKDQEFHITNDTKFLDKDGEPTGFDSKSQALRKQFEFWAQVESKFLRPFAIESKLVDGKEVAISIKLPLVSAEREKAKEKAFRDSLIGKPLPAFKMTDTEGIVLSNADVSGKLVLIDFWATWCEPCLKASPIVQGLHEKYAGKGLEVLGASIETPSEDAKLVEKLKKYKQDSKHTYKILFNADGLAESCHLRGIPTMLVVDRKGCIRDVQAGLFDPEILRSKLEETITHILDEGKRE